MKMEFDFQHGHWLFTDDDGAVWRLVPTGDPAMPLIHQRVSHAPATKTRNTSDDVGMDEQGRPFMLGEEAGREQARIIEDPDATPVLLVATLHGDVGIRVYGPPSRETADLLDQVARQYRTAVDMARAKPQ